MTDISIIVGGVETLLPSLGALVSHTGWGMPPIDIYTTRAPGQHGDTWGGYALAPRFASLVFKMKQSELPAMYTLRAQLMALFSPLYPKIIVKFVTLEGTRYFDCHLPGGMVMDWDVQDWAAQGVAVPLMCNDSTCYDPTGLAWTFSLGGGADSFVVPYAVPYTMGASVINQSQIITYPGTWGTFPLIRITGPIANAKITNSGTNEVLDFTGTTIAAGDYYDIDCRFGLKTVTDSAGAYKNDDLVNSQLNTFHIGAAPEVAGGINSINVSGSAVTEASKVEISALVRHLGV